MRRPHSFLHLAAWSLGAGSLLLGGTWQAPAQTPQTDPTLALLLSQPHIDTTGPVLATAEFDPPVLHPGDTGTYRVTFNAMMDSIQWPEDVIAPAQLDLEAGGRGQVLVSVGTNLQPRTTFNTRVRATAEGTFFVPRYLVYVYGKPVTVPEAQLQVVSDPAVTVPKPPQIELEFSTTNAFVGQPFLARVILRGDTSGVVHMLTAVKLLGEGFIADPATTRQVVQPSGADSNSLPAYIFEVEVTPIVAGQIKIGAQGFTAGSQFTGVITIAARTTLPGGPPPYVLLDTPPVAVTVRSVPQAGRLPGYNGAIGRFSLAAPALGTNVVQVGDPVSYTVRITGAGNLARLVPPPPPEVPGWKVFADKPDLGPPALIQGRGYLSFNYTLIPTTEKTRATPVIPFSYFDPDSMTFVALNLPSLPVSVKPSALPLAAAAPSEAGAGITRREPEPKLSDLAAASGRSMPGLTPIQFRGWFPAVHLAPALCFAGLWWWDRRRRYLETHPEVVRRRHARRALRREWAAVRKAASLGDTARFATCAVNAMRAACAPHYPAEPRALVSLDVLPLLPESDESIRGAVQAVFASANADRFAAQPPDRSDLLALRADVDKVLNALEAKL